MITSSGQWCQKHELHWDNPHHEIGLSCHYYIRDATPVEDEALQAWPSLALAHLKNLKEDVEFYKRHEKTSRESAARWKDRFWGVFWLCCYGWVAAAVFAIGWWLCS